MWLDDTKCLPEDSYARTSCHWMCLKRLQSRSFALSVSWLRLRRIQSLFLLILQTLSGSVRRHLSINGCSGIPIKALYRYLTLTSLPTITTVASSSHPQPKVSGYKFQYLIIRSILPFYSLSFPFFYFLISHCKRLLRQFSD